ncbi:hypothetical protein E3N88_03627 [Mikania micrantha]|uniref:Plastid division protein PDV1 n=1 Tax=Mikania micrantha TaxID=192012 RepID=A0A5N6Q9E2_9ASTR|nr:hypothetical protein E3N88_03627 [Mikania micrantha]
MKWEMEMEIEAVLEKIWDLHDKLSDAIHSISRSHFLHSVKSLRNSSNKVPDGFVYVKDFPIEQDDDSAIHEAKSLNSIRTALENLEDQLEFFHVSFTSIRALVSENTLISLFALDFARKSSRDFMNEKTAKMHQGRGNEEVEKGGEETRRLEAEKWTTVQTQQRAERDAAIARLEQSRIVLALRLADHHGNKYKVIEEARAFVGEVQNHAKFVHPENGGYMSAESYDVGKRSNILVRVVISSFNFARKSLKVDHLGGVLGNAALFAVSMLALLHLQQVNDREQRYIPDLQQRHEADNKLKKNVTKVFVPEGGSSNGLDVLSARG